MEIPKIFYFKLRSLILPINEIISFIPNSSNILDLGCGKGLILKHLKNFNSYTGIDINTSPIVSKENIQFIKENCVSFVENDISRYDCFLVIDLLHHINQDLQLKFLDRILKSLKKGDVLIIKDIYPRNFITKFWNSFHDLIVSKQIINYVNFIKFEKSLENLFTINAKFYKRIFLYDHYFLIIKKN
tara:strand:- start:850 stop:1410 length:561 start_codon:yes stop_codon:yes gene_type:complete